MAKNIGIVKFSGTIGGMTGVNSKERHHLRDKKEIPLSTYQTSPSYESFRQNGNIWGGSSQLRMSFLNGLGMFGKGCSNSRMYSRMTGVMSRVIKSDAVSPKGAFKAVNGIATENGKSMLNNFEFNRDCELSTVLHETYRTDWDSGTLWIDGFVPKKWIKAPVAATHVMLQSGVYRYDFESGAHSLKQSESFTFAVSSASATDLVLSAGIPEGTGTLVFLLSVLFFQEVNGKMYSLKGEKGGCMKIVEVAD